MESYSYAPQPKIRLRSKQKALTRRGLASLARLRATNSPTTFWMGGKGKYTRVLPGLGAKSFQSASCSTHLLCRGSVSLLRSIVVPTQTAKDVCISKITKIRIVYHYNILGHNCSLGLCLVKALFSRISYLTSCLLCGCCVSIIQLFPGFFFFLEPPAAPWALPYVAPRCFAYTSAIETQFPCLMSVLASKQTTMSILRPSRGNGCRGRLFDIP